MEKLLFLFCIASENKTRRINVAAFFAGLWSWQHLVMRGMLGNKFRSKRQQQQQQQQQRQRNEPAIN
jgi:hypothetical protein